MRNNIKTTTKTSFRSKALSALKRVKDKTIDVTSDVLSYPARARGADMERMANDKLAQINLRRTPNSVPDKGNESDPLFRARISEINTAFDREQERRKQEGALKSSLKD